MTFDKTQPTDTTKIRNLGTVIRPNWVAIEEAASSFKPRALNLDNRTVLGVPVNPTAIANSMILFSKSDASGKTQLYTIDPDSHVTQISNNFSPLSAKDGYTWLPGGMMFQWGLDHANNGNNTITFPLAFSNPPYNIQTTMYKSSGGTEYQITIRKEVGHAPTATKFEVYNPNSGHDFFWIAIGRKV